MNPPVRPLSDGELHELKRWNTPTIYNGWEQITRHNCACDAFNLEEVRDFMPQMGPMAGYAVTVVFEPSNPQHPKTHADAWVEYRRYVASVPGPKVVVVQDLDKPRCVGAFWGEVNSNAHLALGCVGTIVDGAIRDLDEMTGAGFKALARRLCVGHAHSFPVRWNCEVEVFGRRIQPGQLIHADKHGFMAIPFGDEPRLLEAARFMDSAECRTVIRAARDHAGRSSENVIEALRQAGAEFSQSVRTHFGRDGEW
jgi:4-hydroxy-4-methyl-2-oxoglutarate aldolase